MVGPSADGKAWVNPNNRCRGLGGACGAPMPLPASHGRHCPQCGARVPTWEEMQTGALPEPGLPRVCECGEAVTPYAKFCTRCGAALK